MKEKVEKWVKNGRDFNAGISLLSESGKNKPMVRIMAGREFTYADKLYYELLKIAGISASDFGILQVSKEAIVKTSVKKSDVYVPVLNPVKDNRDKKQLPPETELLIKLHAADFKERAILHEAMGNLGNENTDAIVSKRKQLSDKIHDLSYRIDTLFTAKEEFYRTGKIYTAAELFPEKSASKPEEKELSDNEDALKKMKKNFQSANTKDQNLLDYQQEKKGTKPAPMPKGPKRTKIELRIDQRKIDIEAIDFKLLEIASQNK